jgi:TctA family transporter
VRARVFPRDAAILLIIGGVIGFWIAIVPGAGAPLAVAVAWMGMWLLRSDRGGQAERRPPRRR